VSQVLNKKVEWFPSASWLQSCQRSPRGSPLLAGQMADSVYNHFEIKIFVNPLSKICIAYVF